MGRALLVLALVACHKEPTMTVAQYEATNTKLINDVTAVFVAGGTDCTKLAAGVAKFDVDHAAEMRAVVAWESSHAKEKADYDQRVGNKLLEDFGQTSSAGLAACMSDPAFRSAWDHFTK